MKAFLLLFSGFLATVCCERQTEVVTKVSGYIVEEKIISDISGEREEHRSKITDHVGHVVEHVVIKLFTKRLLISYNSNDSICLVAPLDDKETPLPTAVFDDVKVGETIMASQGKIVNEGVVDFSAVDVEVSQYPEEVLVECGEKTPEFIRPTTFAVGNRVKRAFYGPTPNAPGSCGQELRYKTKCTEKATTIPYCYKDYYYHKLPCADPPPNTYSGGKNPSYGGGGQDPPKGYGGGQDPPPGYGATY